ncbi:MAG: alpha-amylase family glycosyl hydrolase [Anaeromyxobacter sp.]
MSLPRALALALLAALGAPAASRAQQPAACSLPGAHAAPPPAWHRGAVVYGVVPPLFDADRPLRGVTARLGALAALGVDVLWLAPVTDTDDRGHISYAVTDYLKLRPDYGTPADLSALVAGAHARGIKVLLDVVPNHTSVAHPLYRDAERRGRASPSWALYARDEDGKVRHDFDWAHLPKLDHRNPEVRRMLTRALVHWVERYDVDGFRVDAAWGPQAADPTFWPELVQAVRRVKPAALLVAEASARDPAYIAEGFDAAYDWTGELGHWAWEGVFEDPAHAGPKLDAALGAGGTPPDRVLRFLDNNDTGDRFVTRHGAALTRAAAALVHALPGLAVIYTGEEVGAAYRPYDDGPPVRWGDDPLRLRPHYARLAALRERLPALRDGAYRRAPVEGNEGAFAFVRDAGTAGYAVVVANLGEAATVRVALPIEPGEAPTWDAVGGRPVPARLVGPSTLELELPARTAVILVPAPGCAGAAR